jgi:hypothetical protein
MRLALVSVALIGVVAGLVWLVAASMILLAFRYRAWEVVLIGFLLDFAWQPAGAITVAFPLFTAASVVIVWAFEPVRAQFLS